MRWYESNGDAPETRDREHTRDNSTVFDKWYDGTNASMEVVMSKQFYVRPIQSCNEGQVRGRYGKNESF